MLSICIPVYNSEISELVDSLLNQIKELNYQIEICLIDDASTNPKYDVLGFKHPKIIGYKNANNAGRAKVRNQFIDLVNQPYLLFLDGDSKVIRPDFLKRYCEIVKSSEVQVICGASVYQSDKPAKSHYLRWKYSTIRESKSLEERKQNINLGFKTNNFIIQREILKRIKFNESIEGYGHEDSLFGFDLKKSKVKIEHVDNPVLNYSLDDNLTFLKKTEEGVRNLKHVLHLLDYDEQFMKSSKLSRVYVFMERFKIRRPIYFLISIVHPINRFFLVKGLFVLPMFDLYKLKYMLR